MQVGLVTPPGVLGQFVSQALEIAGHRLAVAPELESLFEQSESKPEVVLFAPIVNGMPAARALELARAAGIAPERAVYLGLDVDACEAAQRAGFFRALQIPFQTQELLATIESSARGRLRVLLADDSDLIHRHTVPLLDAAGYDVSEAWDGEQALAMIRESKPDLLLTDVEMPKMDGYSLCRTVKQDDRLADMPVVICSSLGEAADLERGFDAGADDYLVKPVVPEDLVSRLHSLLASRMVSAREAVLVVDDSAAIRHLVADCLRRQGFRIETAVDGQDGLEKAQAKPPDLVLTDYDMPRMTGFQLVHALRRDRSTRDIPIVMLTARESKRDQAQMRAAGLTSYLVKPFGTDKCIAIVERVLAESRLSRYKEASRLYISEGAVKAAEELSKGRELGEVRAREVDATLLFSDISGFTSMSSKMSPSEVVAILNEAFDALCIVIKDLGGDIDKFIGDAIMAVFEDRTDHDEPHALRATRAAWGMQQALLKFNSEREKPLIMRIGLNAGQVIRGDIGSRFVRRDYTCIGDVVNRAQRHESKAPLGGVLMSSSVYERISSYVDVEEMTGLTFKGIDEPQSAFVLKGFREMKSHHLLGLGALTLFGFFSTRSDAADEASRYPYDPVCPWGRVSDGRGMLVRCIRKEEKALLLAGTCNGAPLPALPSASASASAAPVAPAPELSPDEIAKTLRVEVTSVTPDQGKLPGADKKLAQGRDKFLACVAKNGGLEKDEGEVHVRFLVSDRGRAEGVSVAKRNGVSEKAAHCVADVVDRRAVGTPESPMLGATAVVKFSRVKSK